MRTVIIYVRVSTEDQVEKYGIPIQLRVCREYAASHNLQVIEEIIDDGYTGATMDRPGLHRLRRLLIGERKIDVVLMLDADRLSRELVHLLILKPEIERNARLEFATCKFEDTPSGRMFFGIRGVIAQYERELTRERTMRGKNERARAGLIVGGRIAYGYGYNEGALIVDEPRAAMVRSIFALYDSGTSIRAITRQLRETGTPSWSGRKWGHSSVSRILANETYAGVAYYGTHQRNGKVLKLRTPSERITLIAPAIIDRDQWQRVQARRAAGPAATVGRPSSACLLRGLLYCSACNKRMHGERSRKNHAYRCAGRDTLRHAGDPCRASIAADKLDAAVWSAIVQTFSDAAVLRSALQRREQELRSVGPARVNELRAQVTRLKRKEESALGMMLDPDLVDARATVKQQYRAAVEQRRRLEVELGNLERSQGVSASTEEWLDETVALIRRFIRNLTDAAKKQEFVRRLVERADWNGEEVRMRCFIDAKLDTTSTRYRQFSRVEFVVTARVAA